MKVPSILNKPIEYLATRKWMAKECEKGFLKPEAFAATMMVTSIVSKDLVGCAVYTTQSWNNKKIPEDKRKFVAMTDLTNGIIMVGGQFLAGKVIEKKIGPSIFGKYFSGQKEKINKEKGVMEYFDIPDSKAPLTKDHVHVRCDSFIKENAAKLKTMGFDTSVDKDVKSITKELVAKFARDGKQAKAIKTGFGIIVTAIGTTALVKRTLAPLLSTPLASAVKKKYVDNKPSGKKSEKAKSAKKSEEKPNLDDKLLDHTQAPWAYANNGDDKKVIQKVS